MASLKNQPKSQANDSSGMTFNVQRIKKGILTATILCFCLIFYFEFQRLQAIFEAGGSFVGWLVTFDLETIYFLALPILLLKTFRSDVELPIKNQSNAKKEPTPNFYNSFKLAWGLSLFVLFLSISLSYLISEKPTKDY